MSDLRIGGVPIAKLKVAELKAELEARELSKTGKKDELVARLISFMEVNECSEPSSENSSRTDTPNAEVSELWAKQREEMLAAAQKNKEEAERQAAEEAAEEEEQRRKKEEEKAERQRKAEEVKRAKEEEKRRKEEEKRQLAEEQAKAEAEEAAKREEEQRRKAAEEEQKREAEKAQKAKEEQKKKEAEEKRLAEEKRAADEAEKAEEKAKAEKKAAEENARKIKLAAEEAERWMEEKKQQEEEKRREETRKKEEERKREAARLKEEKAKAEQKAKEERDQKKREEEEKRRAEEAKKRAEHEKVKEEERKKKEEERKQREEERKKREADREKDEQRMKDRQKRFEDEKKKQEASTNGNSRGAEEKKATSADADEEALDFEPEAAADDTLVMEVDQHDLVDHEDKEEVINAKPGEVTSLRKLGGNKTQQGERKRGWGAGGARLGSDGVAISSNTLKDLVPDPKNLLEKPDIEIEEELGADVAGPKAPKGQEPPKKRRKIPETDLSETEVIIITNLTRPFTVNQLKEMLKRTGTIVDFWIDRIKSKCCVEFSNSDQASETRMALDGVTWPAINPKTLRVAFSSKEEMKKLAEGGDDAGVAGRVGVELEGRSLLRDWDRNKVDQDKERERERLVEERRGRREVRERSVEEPPPVATKSLEELFKKTTAGPAIYWRPLSEEEIQAKIDEKKKKIEEVKSQKDMMSSKEAQEKTKKMGEALGIVPASNRKRSRSSSGSPR